jgi:hypothetical protein
MNYSELVQAVKDYTENEETSFVNNIPVFVRQTEERLNRSVIMPEMRKTSQGTLTQANRFLTKPSDFLAVFSLAVLDASSNYSYLLPKDVNFIREAYPAVATQGFPKYYGHFSDGSVIVAPTPDAAYTVQLAYYYDPVSIVTAGTSWYGDNAETALLYGTLIEAYTYMKGEQDLIQLYEKRYTEALQQLYILGEGRLRRDTYRNNEPRPEVT